MTVLKIAGLVLLVVVLIVVVVGYILLRKFRSFMRSAAESAQATPPCRISLQAEPAPKWRSENEFAAWTEEFKKLGFEEVGTFMIPELQGLQLKGFCHRSEQLYGVIYDHQKIPASFDIVCSYVDGTSLTGANTTFGDTVDEDPKDEKVRINTSSVAEVFALFSKRLQSKPRKLVTAGNFVAHFQKGYADGMNWRMKKGGTSREEIKRQAKKDGMELTEEQFEETYEEMRNQYVGQLRAACVAQFLDDSKMPVVEWQRISDRVLAIPETLEWKEVREILEMEGSMDDEQEDELSKIEFPMGTNALEMMDRVMRENIGGLKLEKKGEVQEPVRAYILLTRE